MGQIYGVTLELFGTYILKLRAFADIDLLDIAHICAQSLKIRTA